MDYRKCVEKVDAHNAQLDYFMTRQFPALLRDNGIDVSPTGMIKMVNYFKANEILNQQGFRDKAMHILIDCRAAGWNVKISCDNKLVFNGGRIEK